MLERLIDFCLANRALVIVGAIALVASGLWSARQLPFDAFPDTTPVMVTVNTTAPALSPLEIERRISVPLEESIAGLPGLVEVRSISKFGFSQITAVFDDDTDLYLARQVVSERLAAVSLPDGVEGPSLGPVSTGLGEVFQYVLRSDTLDAQELRTLHHWVVRPRMLQVPGVAEINTWGGFEKQYHVVIQPERLLKHELTLDDVAAALARNNLSVGGGVVSRGGEAQLVQGVALLTSQRDIERVVVAAVDGTPIRIEDVADVVIGHEIRRGAATADGRGEAVLGLGFMLYGENSRELTRRLEARLAEVARDLPEGVEIEAVYSRTELVDQVLVTVRNNLLEGALLVVAVLFVFLGNLRAGIIVALAIPLSMLFAANLMMRFGVAGSLMSLGAIDFGLVVDSSVIMVENAARRVEEDTTGRAVRDIVRDAAVEVRRPTLFGELIIAIVYLPILALEGVEGKLFQPMALTVIFALAGSMLLSLTLVPALASLTLSRRRSGARHREPWLVRLLVRTYRPVLGAALRARWLVLVLAVLAVANAAWLATRLGAEFVPQLREGAIAINTVRLAGVSLEESVRIGTRLEARLLEAFPDEISRVWTRTGTAEVATDPMGLEVSDVFLVLKPREQWTRASTQDELVAELARELESVPGMRTIFTQPIEMRLNEMNAGIRADLGIKLFGDDFAILREKAAEIAAVVERIPGAADVTVEQITGLPLLQVEVYRDAIARYGVDAQAVLELVAALGEIDAGEVIEGQRRFDLVIRLPDEVRFDTERIGALLVETPSGQRIPLRQLASVEVVEGPSTITREWARRRVVVQVNVRDRDIASFVHDVKVAVATQVALPEDYHVEYGGQFENLERARERLMIVVPIALILIFGLLLVTYGRAIDALRVFTGVPFAAVGGVLALYLRELPFSISAGVGFVALSGVAVLGDMVLVSRVQDLLRRGLEPVDAVREAAVTRLRPVLMTALVAALGFLPMALNSGIGAEVQRPLATVVIGGIVTSTVATLVVLPVLYVVFGARLPASRLPAGPHAGTERSPGGA